MDVAALFRGSWLRLLARFGTFAFGLKVDVSALSALQLATFVGRSFVPLPLV